MSRRIFLWSLLILYSSLIFDSALVRCQKISEEEPLDAAGGSGFNPDDEDFDGESGLPPEGLAEEHHHNLQATTSKSSPVRTGAPTIATTLPPVTFTRTNQPKQPSTHEVPSGDIPSPFMSTYAMMAVVALAVLLVLIIVIVIGCCCRRSQRNEYTRGEARSKSYV
ncbi:hypothetical protein DdX_02134 [Ditylenchus destructor]|uniref:Uncharacterized protein n=1 Tax=Ditylenchus destructor TaxID=166010 RepID=A0AAD4R8U6_9BILA|nr:hypothetical protein DdX_02134 [Ditylenchus destructor]